MRAVVLGSRIRIITAAKRFGLYSALRQFRAMLLRSSEIPRFAVETMFYRSGRGMSVGGAEGLGTREVF
jgi:hypothetical protein